MHACLVVCPFLFCRLPPAPPRTLTGHRKHQCKARGRVWEGEGGLNCSRCPSVMSSPYRPHSLRVKHLLESSELSSDPVAPKSQLGHYKRLPTWLSNRCPTNAKGFRGLSPTLKWKKNFQVLEFIETGWSRLLK